MTAEIVKVGLHVTDPAQAVQHPSASIAIRVVDMSQSLRSRPLSYKHFRVSFPDKHVVQVTLDRQQKLNCVDKATSCEIAQIWKWFDQDESLWVAIITGAGRAFCTGADLHGTHLFLFPFKLFLRNKTDPRIQSGTQ
jgi:hypothetical protein